MLRPDAGCHFHDDRVGSLVVRRVREPHVKISLLRRIGATVCRLAALELHPEEIADDLDGSLLRRFEGRKRGPEPLSPGLLTDAGGHVEIDELLKVDRLKRSRHLATVLEPVKCRISTLALYGTAVKILGQHRRVKEQKPREDDEKNAELVLHHDVSPLRKAIKTIAWFLLAESQMLLISAMMAADRAARQPPICTKPIRFVWHRSSEDDHTFGARTLVFATFGGREPDRAPARHPRTVGPAGSDTSESAGPRRCAHTGRMSIPSPTRRASRDDTGPRSRT